MGLLVFCFFAVAKVERLGDPLRLSMLLTKTNDALLEFFVGTLYKQSQSNGARNLSGT